jgi:hypothetical protein
MRRHFAAARELLAPPPATLAGAHCVLAPHRCKQWGFQKWKLDRWLDFDGHTIRVFKCSGQPPAGTVPYFTLPMDISVCMKDPTNDKRFTIDTGTSMVHFKTDDTKTCSEWCTAFSAAQVETTDERIDLIKTQKKYNEKISGTSGDYFLGEMLGAGGFASVKGAIHAETGLRVAAKIMPAASAAEPEHKQEIVHMAALRHKNVVELKDIVFVQGKGKSDGKIYIMLELMTGERPVLRWALSFCLIDSCG